MYSVRRRSYYEHISDFLPEILPKNTIYGTKYSRMDQVKFSKGCLPQILLGPFLNTWILLIFRNFQEQLFNRTPPVAVSYCRIFGTLSGFCKFINAYVF